MQIPAETVKELREKCGAGVMDCRNALIEAEGNVDKAFEALQAKGFQKAAKKAERVTGQGVIEAYVHTGGRVGALVELNCETDFVARTDEFKKLAHEVAMQVAAMCPIYLSEAERPEDCEEDAASVCLLSQAYIKDPSKSINDLITEVIARTGENIRLKRFARFELGG
ncbi:MAG: translation elongation factor Ts [Dehalogenimonas sp.]|uniref:Elongation factor Ts n=1 Tax=Candidatus Dehalogenimonas loeffleri TaxID=3127115 RepID=A0ABZ2J3Z6_9CHLR|nr:translation elongation factor Ts [Dehalogenimonas sp.]